MGQCVRARAETVHQQQADVRAAGFPKLENLADHQVEEIHAIADGEQAFRTLQTHAGAEAAIELDDDRLREKQGIGFSRRGDFLEGSKSLRRRDGVLGNHPRFIAAQGLVIPAEGTDRGVAHAGGGHLGFESVKVCHRC